MKKYFLQKAEENLPKIYAEKISISADAKVLHSGDSFVLDLGNHHVGYFSFVLGYTDIYPDAPVRLCVKFCEQKDELDADYSLYKGVLSPSWLQEEIINVDDVGEYKMPRRYAARYIKISVVFTPREITLSNFVFTAVTSADKKNQVVADIEDPELKAIDAVGMNTLKNCMQRVFEDGPKRDRRLWTGDLRLEALANYYTFGNMELVKRCLYLFAAAERDKNGIMPGYIYENPIFVSGTWFLQDYSLMYVCTLCDYYLNTHDADTFKDLYSVAFSVMDAIDKTRNESGIVTLISGGAFVDWCNGLKKNTLLHGIYLYTLDLWCSVLDELNYSEAEIFHKRLFEGRKAAYDILYSEEKNAIINEIDEFQYSVHSATWMVLGGVIEGERAKNVLLDVLNSTDSVKPFTPYMHHYTVEALIKAGLMKEAEEYVRNIWGGMVKLGADTFFEAYVPGDPDFSPYNDWKVNSMCHAWSCTATYFIRKYGFGK